jgi:hypothetical protein
MANLVPDGLTPPNPLTAVQELNKIVRGDEAVNRVAVHTFDPDASPEAKAQAAGAGKDKLKSVKQAADDAGGKGIVPFILCHR